MHWIVGTDVYPIGVIGAAVALQDDYFLSYVDQPTGQIPAVGGPQRGVGQTFAGSVGGDEVLQRGQPLAEAGLDGQVDDPPLGVAHQAAHAGHLFDLGNVTLGPRPRHYRDAAVVGQLLFH